ncbi:MAG: SMR family transporter [Methylococcales bacterium]|nr:SMR family transporter [Methylococcales bacterium]
MKIEYLYLFLTIVFDSLGIAFLNKADGLIHLKYLLLGLALLNLGLICLSLALKTMDMTIANTTFAGLSSLLVALIGYFYFGEKYTLFQYICVTSVLFGVAGLNMTGLAK